MNEVEKSTMFALLLAEMQNKTEQTVKSLVEHVEKQEAQQVEHDKRIENIESYVHYIRPIEEGTEYITASELGNMYQIKISPVRMNKLLRWAGIAKKVNGQWISALVSNKKQLYKEKFGKTDFEHHYIVPLWHKEECFKIIDRKLKTVDMYDAFYNCQNSMQKDIIIDNLVKG